MSGRSLHARWMAGILCCSAFLLGGCGDFFTKSTSGGGSTVGNYVYVGTQGGLLASYSVSSTGALAALSGSPLQLSTSAVNALAVTPGNTYMYAAVAGIGVYGLGINTSTGVASLINSSALVQDVSPIALTIDPTGKYLLVAGLANGVAAVGEYGINSDGTLAEVQGSPISVAFPSGTDLTNLSVQSISVAPNSSYVFVSMGQLGVAPLPFNTSGGLSANTIIINPRTSGNVSNQDLGEIVNSTSTAFFVAETNVGVRVFTIGSGSSFKEITGSPFAAGGRPRALSFDGTGDYLYVGNATDNTISGFSVLASGSLTPLSGSPYSSVGQQPNALSLDQSKKYLIAVNFSGTANVQLFSFDATTAGKLDAGASASDASQATSIASTH